jgi:hypothetical protein
MTWNIHPTDVLAHRTGQNVLVGTPIFRHELAELESMALALFYDAPRVVVGTLRGQVPRWGFLARFDGDPLSKADIIQKLVLIWFHDFPEPMLDWATEQAEALWAKSAGGYDF